MSRLQFNLSTQALAKLFRVRCMHTYYGDHVCKDFEFSPSPECEIELRNDRLTFKKVPGGFMVFYHKSQSTPLLKSPAFRPKKLTFLVHNPNREFLNFSDLPYIEPGELFYFSNLQTHTAGKNPILKLLHPKEYANGTEDSVLANMPKAFDFGFEKEVRYTDILVKDAWGTPLSLPELPEDMATVLLNRHRIDLNEFPEGKYELSVKGNKKFNFHFYAGGPAFEDCQGVIELHFTDEVANEFKISDNKDIYPQEYHIQIKARETFWRYNLINRSDAEFSAHSIESREHKIKFSKAEEVTLLNGLSATRLTSQVALPLKQFAEHKFELKMKKNGRGIRTPIRLPIPSTKMIQPDPKDKDKVYSEMFVYL